jgi:type VI secretion system secreted protein Hcp
MARDCFLQLKEPEVKGESIDAQLKDSIEIMSWSWSETQSASARSTSGTTSGRVDSSDINVQKLLDKASPHLLLKCALGQTFKQAIITVRKAVGAAKSQQPYLVITLDEVLISNYSISGSDGGGTPIETVSLNFAKMKFDYKVQDDKGNLAAAGPVTVDFAKGESS